MILILFRFISDIVLIKPTTMPRNVMHQIPDTIRSVIVRDCYFVPVSGRRWW